MKNAFEKSLRPALIFLSLRSNMGGALRDVTKVTHSIASQENDIGTKQKCQIINRSVAAGCSNTARSGIALISSQKDPVLRKQWER